VLPSLDILNKACLARDTLRSMWFLKDSLESK
jgi:hypothetical protein